MIVPLQKDDVLLADIEATARDPRSLHVWWLGQSGFLVHHDGARVLFDPYLSDSLTQKYANTDKPHVRMTERCIDPARLESIDVITSSHMHTDHFDAVTLRPLFEINRDAAFVLPIANLEEAKKKMGENFPKNVRAINDGDSIAGARWEIQGIVAAHNEVERDEAGHSRYMGFWLRLGSFRIYHSGDTLWHDDIARDVRRLGCDLAFLPINGNKPERRVAGNLNGAEAAALAREIGAGLVVPHHFEMFEFNTESPGEFEAACGRLGQNFRTLRCGERLSLAPLGQLD